MGACNSNDKLKLLQMPSSVICKECSYEFTCKYNKTYTKALSIEESTISNISQQSGNRSDSSSPSKKEQKKIMKDLQQQYKDAYEQHYLQIHMCLYDENQNFYYCKFGHSCSFAHKDYKVVEKHALENHIPELQSKHHQKFIKGIKRGRIGLNRNGSDGYYCTDCQLLFKDQQEHDLVCQHSNVSHQSLKENSSLEKCQDQYDSEFFTIENPIQCTYNGESIEDNQYKFSAIHTFQETDDEK